MTLSATRTDDGIAPAGADARRAMRCFRTVVETALDGVVICDAGGSIAFVNPEAVRLFGHPQAVAAELRLTDLFAPSSRTAAQRALDRPGAGRRVEATGLAADGRTFPMLVAIGRTVLPEGTLVTATLRDLSSLCAAQGEARRHLEALAHVTRQAAISDLASGLAHEVSQPLTAILVHAGACRRLLADEQTPPQAIAGAVEQILRQGQRAAGLMQHLRDFLHPNAAQRQPGLLNAAVKDVLELLHHEVVRIGAGVDLDLDPELPALRMDRVAIEQVIFNLVRNALDAVSRIPAERRRVWISTRRDGEQRALAVTVGDLGPGLPPGDTAQLFEPYFSTKPQGLGLGLSICRRIVESHGGSLWATRNGGDGASFHFALPLDRREPT